MTDHSIDWNSVPTRHVSQKALYSRIRRYLAHCGERLCKSRSWDDFRTFGAYYCIGDRNCVTSSHHDLGTLGHNLGLLRPDEYLAA